MSVPVPLGGLHAAVEERGPSAYLLTVSDDGTLHAVHASVRWEDETIVVDVGKRSTANAAARPSVSLLFAVRAEGDYSLIVDGMAVLASTEGGPDPSSSCSADCVPLLPAKSKPS